MANITGFKSKYQENELENKYLDYLRVKAKINQEYYDATEPETKKKAFKLAPLRELKSAQQNLLDATYQSNKALTNLKKIMADKDAGASLDLLLASGDVELFNRFFIPFEKEIAGQSDITPAIFFQIWTRYVEKLDASGTTGIFIPSQKADSDALVAKIDELIYDTGLSDFGDVRAMIEDLYNNNQNDLIQAIYNMLKTKKEFDKMARETDIDRKELEKEKAKWKNEVDAVMSGLLLAEQEATAKKEKNKFESLAVYETIITKIDVDQSKIMDITDEIEMTKRAYEDNIATLKQYVRDGEISPVEYRELVNNIRKRHVETINSLKSDRDLLLKGELFEVEEVRPEEEKESKSKSEYNSLQEIQDDYENGLISIDEYEQLKKEFKKKPQSDEEKLTELKREKNKTTSSIKKKQLQKQIDKLSKKIDIEKQSIKLAKEEKASQIFSKRAEKRAEKRAAEKAKKLKEEPKPEPKVEPKPERKQKGPKKSRNQVMKELKPIEKKFRDSIEEQLQTIEPPIAEMTPEQYSDESILYNRGILSYVDAQIKEKVSEIPAEELSNKKKLLDEATKILGDVAYPVLANQIFLTEAYKNAKLSEVKEPEAIDEINMAAEHEKEQIYNMIGSFLLIIQDEITKRTKTFSMSFVGKTTPKEFTALTGQQIGFETEADQLMKELTPRSEIELLAQAEEVHKKGTVDNPTFGLKRWNHTSNAKDFKKEKLIAYIVYALTGQTYSKKFFTSGEYKKKYGGKGLKKTTKKTNKSRTIRGGALGIGISDKFIPFGNYLIHTPSLERGFLTLKYKSKYPVKEYSRIVISSVFRNILNDIIHENRFCEDNYMELDDSEKELFDKLITFIKLSNKEGMTLYKHKKITDIERDKNIKRFNILRGELIAGNDNPEIIKELKGLLLKLKNDKVLTKKDYDTVMEDIVLLT